LIGIDRRNETGRAIRPVLFYRRQFADARATAAAAFHAEPAPRFTAPAAKTRINAFADTLVFIGFY